MKKIINLYKNCKQKNIILIIILILLDILLIFLVITGYQKCKEVKEYEETQKSRLDALILKEQEALRIKQLEQEKIRRIYSLDIETDSSLTKFVSSKVSFDDKGYIPDNLVSVAGDHVLDAKGGYQKITKEAKLALDSMAKDFYEEFGKPLVIVSAYRSYLYQKGIKDRGCPDNLCAKAGYSEHQSGLAVDLWEASTEDQFLSKPNLKEYFKWLTENAHKYGFHNSYQKGLEIDTYEIEPWHWRYMGVELATYLKQQGLTFAEFYDKKLKEATE